MTDVNITFCRLMLKSVKADMTPEQRKATAAGWVILTGFRDHWEFHCGDFYWHGTADNAYDARYKGLRAWLTEQGAE